MTPWVIIVGSRVDELLREAMQAAAAIVSRAVPVR
jgi:hypothetical protein